MTRQRADVVLLLAWAFCVVAAIFIGRTVRDTLFLAHEGAGRLPIMYVVSPLATTLVGLGYARIAAKVPRARLTIATAFAIAAAILAVRLTLGPSILYYVLYAAIDCSAVLLSVQYWLTAGDRFSPREAKRMFGILAAGGTAATITSGLAVTALVQRTGAENLLFAYVVLCALVAVCAIVMARRPAGYTASVRPRAAAVAGKPPPGASHLRLLPAIFLAMVLALTLLDFQFKSIAADAFNGDRVGMVRFFGLLYVSTAAAALIVQLALQRRILVHLGIVGALLLLPTALGFGALALIIAPSLVSATACKAADATFRNSVNDAGLQLLYLPVPAAERSRRKSRIDTVMRPSMEGAVGIGLLVYRSTVGARTPLAIAALVVIAVWIAIVLRMRRAYVVALGETLRKRRIDSTDARLTAEDVRAVKLALASDDVDVVRRGLDLARLDPAAVADELRALVAHGDAAIRADAIATASSLDGATLAGALADADPAVRAAAARASAPSPALAALLGDPDPAVAAAAAETLARDGDAAAIEYVRTQLGDRDAHVRRCGLTAAAAIHDLALAPALVERLGDRHDGRAAALALAAIGAAVEPTLAATLDGRDDARAAGAVVAYGRLAAAGSATALDRLVAAATDAREVCRDAACAALARVRRAGTIVPEPALVDACMKELTRAFTAMAAAQGLGNAESMLKPDGTRVEVPYLPDSVAGPAALISRALRERAERAQARLFELLAALEPDLDLPTVRANLRDPDPARRANAVELLDARRWPPSIAPLKQLALAVVDDSSRDAKLAAAMKRLSLPRYDRDAWVDKLLADRSPWMRACTAYYAGAARDVAAKPRLAKLVADPHPLVAETARAALQRIDHPSEQPTMLTTAEKVLFLKGAELFAALPGEDVAAIAAAAEEISCDGNEVIFSAGDFGDALYLIVEGSVKITRDDRVLATLGIRDVFGEMALLDPAPRSATAVAAEPVVLVRLGQDDFSDVLADRPEVAAGVLRVLTRRLRAANSDAR